MIQFIAVVVIAVVALGLGYCIGRLHASIRQMDQEFKDIL